MDASPWIKVVTDPLGLAGFALFLVFGLLARFSRSRQPRWFVAGALSMAFVALLGGIGLAWIKAATKEQAPHASTPGSTTPPMTQTTLGTQSPAVQGVGGDVIITTGKEKAASNKEQASRSPPTVATTQPMSQTTYGAQSPAVQGAGGNVVITIGNEKAASK